MRVNKYGKNISLKGDVTDIITDSIPANEENDSFLSSKDMERMIDSILVVIVEHIIKEE